MVRTTPGIYIQEYNRINVAITRARHGLVIIGNKSNLSTDAKWASLLEAHADNVVSGIAGAKEWVENQKLQYLRRVLSSKE